MKRRTLAEEKLDHFQRLHRVYSELLTACDLTKEHRNALVSRGFTDAEIKANQYKSLPLRRSELAARIARKVEGARGLKGVPGFWLNENGEWQIAGKSGILIPIRNLAGLIVGLKIRVDKPGTASSKYILLSSDPRPDKKTKQPKYPGGTRAIVQIHYPREQPAQKDIVRVTEGELKADIAVSFTEEYTIALPGVSAWRLGLEALLAMKPGRVLIAFDADKTAVTGADDGTVGADFAYNGQEQKPTEQDFSTQEDDGANEAFPIGRALASLYCALKERGFDVAIEDWPAEAGKGIDDVLVNGATDQMRLLTGEEADAFARELLEEPGQDGWVYVVGVKRFYHTGTLLELDKEQFADRYCHECKGNPALAALKNPTFPKVDLPIYLPAQPLRLTRGDKTYLNTWRPNPLRPEVGVDVKTFLDHCEYLVPDETERGVLLDWLAFQVQRPGEKVMWAMLLQGQQGTGKSYFGWLMRLMLGEHNVSMPTNDVIHEVFTAWQKACQLVVVEEVMARGRLELMNKLKPMITQPITVVREMHKPAYEQPNVFNLLMFTNHEDAIIIDETDRRYCVIYSPAVPRSAAYYEELWAWSTRTAGGLLGWLQARDLSAFKPYAHAPMTEGKKALIRASMMPLQAWLSECQDAQSWPLAGDIVSAGHLLDCLPGGLRNSSLQAVGKALAACGCRQLGQVRLASGASIRAWSTRRHEIWASAGREAIAAEYEKWSSAREPGGNPMLDARPV